jgi:hypothetical protein
VSKALCIALVLLLAGVSAAEGESKYDWRTGSPYRWSPDSMGNAQAQGFNAETGSRWLGNIQADGRVRGTDSSSRPPRYERRTSGSKYDWKTGSSYRWQTDPAGNTRVHGFNAEKGSSWHATIKPDGSMRGTNSNGQPWSYDSSTGTYMNYDSGKIRHLEREW